MKGISEAISALDQQHQKPVDNKSYFRIIES